MNKLTESIIEWLDCNSGETIAVSNHGVGCSMTCLYTNIKYKLSFGIIKVLSNDEKLSLSINVNRVAEVSEDKDIKWLEIKFDTGEEVGLCGI